MNIANALVVSRMMDMKACLFKTYDSCGMMFFYIKAERKRRKLKKAKNKKIVIFLKHIYPNYLKM